MSFYVEKPISLVSDLKSSAIQAVKPVFHFLFYLSHMFVVIKTDEKIWLRKRKRIFKINSYITPISLFNANFSFVHLKKCAIKTFVDNSCLKKSIC